VENTAEAADGRLSTNLRASSLFMSNKHFLSCATDPSANCTHNKHTVTRQAPIRHWPTIGRVIIGT